MSNKALIEYQENTIVINDRPEGIFFIHNLSGHLVLSGTFDKEGKVCIKSNALPTGVYLLATPATLGKCYEKLLFK